MREPSSVNTEAKFQSAIVAAIKHILNRAGHKFVLLESFGLDIAVFDTHTDSARFIEVKVFKNQRNGSVGFGNRYGQGPQVDLLMQQDELLKSLDQAIRWVYADATQPRGSRRYCLFNCGEAKQAAMGEVERGKQNNLKVSALSGLLVDWDHLLDDLKRFVL